MEKTPTKIAIIVGVILIGYAAILALLFYEKPEDIDNPDNKPKEKNQEVFYMILSPHTFWQRTDNKWTNTSDISIYNKHQFKVYNNNQFVGDYYFSYNDKWYLYDQDNNFYNYDVDDKIIAFYGKGTYQVIDFTSAEISAADQQIIASYLAAKEITIALDNLLLQKYLINYASSKISTIYVVSNAFITEGDTGGIRFGYIFGNDGNNNIDIYGYQITDESVYSGCSPWLQNVIDLEKDGKIEVITSCAEFSAGGFSQSLLAEQEDTFKVLIESEAN